MPLHLHHPRPPLDAFIRVMGLSEDYHPASSLERILPDASMTLVIRLDAEDLPLYEPDGRPSTASLKGPAVSGPRSTFHVIDAQCQRSTLTVHFKPGGASPFFDMPAHELANEDAPLAATWKRDFGCLRHRILAAPLPADKFAVMEAVLLRRLRCGRVPSRAVSQALRLLAHGQSGGGIAALAKTIGLSQRRLIHLFRQEVGLTPKTFARVRRFHSVLSRLQRIADPDWADLAFDCGYYDQAHFIHEFKEFCGMTPSGYHARRGPHLLHLPLR